MWTWKWKVMVGGRRMSRTVISLLPPRLPRLPLARLVQTFLRAMVKESYSDAH